MMKLKIKAVEMGKENKGLNEEDFMQNMNTFW